MKLAKFDILYPHEYLLEQQKKHEHELLNMDFETYLSWLHGLKMGLYNIFERELSPKGWEVFEYYNQDDLFIHKLAEKYKISFSVFNLIKKKNRILWWDYSLKELIAAIHLQSFRKSIYKKMVLKRYLQIIQPNIIYLREPCQIDNLVWKDYKKSHLIVSFIGCNMSHPQNWLPHNSDIIFTNIPDYEHFFRQNLIDSYYRDYGIDAISEEEKEQKSEIYDITFIGKLGSKDQERKSDTMEAIARQFDFKWWGPQGEMIQQYPSLLKTWQGYTAGKDLFTIYSQSKIVVNDYVHSNGAYAVNMRMKEVMGMQTLLLSREAINLKEFEQNNLLVTFTNIDDCLQKISYFLQHQEERKMIARKGWKYVQANFGYQDILKEWADIVSNKYKQKFNA